MPELNMTIKGDSVTIIGAGATSEITINGKLFKNVAGNV